MKFSVRGLMRLKPFDELEDVQMAGRIYAESWIFTVGIVASAILAIVGLILSVLGSEMAMSVLVGAVIVSTLLAGIEWSSGLRARALNQLYVTILLL